LSSPLPSYFASIKLANPGSPGKIAVKMDRERERERGRERERQGHRQGHGEGDV